jgi:hypothetical protein
VALDEKCIYARNLEIPAGGALEPRDQWRAYSVFATGGRKLQPRQEILQALTAPAVPQASGFYDECVKSEMQYSLAFFKSGLALPMGRPGSFGAPGAGGSIGFTDPDAGIG